MNSFFLDNFIIEKELNHLAREVKRKQLAKTIGAIEKFNQMQNEIIRKERLSISQYIQKQLSNKNAKKYL